MALQIGSVIYSAVKPIFKIYLIIGSGYTLAKLNVLTVDVTRNLSDMIVMLILPCLAFNKIVGSISISDLKSIGVICLSAAILYTLGAVCSMLTIFTTRVPKKWRGGCIAGGVFPNISDLPIAYIQTLDTGLVFNEAQGNKGIAYVCIFLATFLFCLFNLGGFRLIEYDFTQMNKDIETGDRQQHDLDEKNNQEESADSKVPSVEVAQEQKDNLQPSEQDNSDKPESKSDSDSHISAVTSLSSSVVDTDALPATEAKEYVTEDNSSRRNSSNTRNSLTNRKRRSSNNSAAASRNDNDNLMPVSSALTRLTSYGTASVHTDNALEPTVSRNLELRLLPSQNIRHVINEYSQVNNEPLLDRLNTLTKIATTQLGATSRKDIQQAGSSIPFVQKYHLNWLVFVLQNFLRPASVSLVLSLTVALIPWLKALFVHTPLVSNMKDAPDKLPPLSFIMDYTSYIGQASVPLGLLMLGTTLSRLSMGGDKRFFLSSITLTVLKLCVVPIVGVAWCSKLRRLGWLDDDMIFFVIAVTYSLPSATTQFYFTASYTDPNSNDTTQMNCLSIYFLLQYILLAVSLPFVVTYVVMKQIPTS